MDEGFLLGDFLLDLFEQQVQCFLLAVANDLKLVQEVVDILRWVDLDGVLFAFGLQIIEQALRIFTSLDLSCVRK